MPQVMWHQVVYGPQGKVCEWDLNLRHLDFFHCTLISHWSSHMSSVCELSSVVLLVGANRWPWEGATQLLMKELNQLVSFHSFLCVPLSHILRGPFYHILVFQRGLYRPSNELRVPESLCNCHSFTWKDTHKHARMHIHTHKRQWSQHKAGRWQLYNQRLAPAHYCIIHQGDIMKECSKSLWLLLLCWSTKGLKATSPAFLLLKLSLGSLCCLWRYEENFKLNSNLLSMSTTTIMVGLRLFKLR